MTAAVMDDIRAADPAERLLEESWRSEPRPASRRELLVEMLAGLLFLCVAVPLAAAAFSSHHTDFGLAAVLVLLYALASRMIKFPIGAGYVVPSYLVLVP